MKIITIILLGFFTQISFGDQIFNCQYQYGFSKFQNVRFTMPTEGIRTVYRDIVCVGGIYGDDPTCSDGPEKFREEKKIQLNVTGEEIINQVIKIERRNYNEAFEGIFINHKGERYRFTIKDSQFDIQSLNHINDRGILSCEILEVR